MQGYADIQALNAEKKETQEQLQKTEFVVQRIVKSSLLSFVYVNYFTLHSKEIWFILAITTFFICSAIWSMLHYYANSNKKDK